MRGPALSIPFRNVTDISALFARHLMGKEIASEVSCLGHDIVVRPPDPWARIPVCAVACQDPHLHFLTEYSLHVFLASSVFSLKPHALYRRISNWSPNRIFGRSISAYLEVQKTECY